MLGQVRVVGVVGGLTGLGCRVVNLHSKGVKRLTIGVGRISIGTPLWSL